MASWIILSFVITLILLFCLFGFWQRREKNTHERMIQGLLNSHKSLPEHIDLTEIEALPAPVKRYFQTVFSESESQRPIKVARIRQRGVIRTDVKTDKWLSFTAAQVSAPESVGFVWQAKVQLPLGFCIGVIDSYIGGAGSGRVSLQSAFLMARESDNPPLNSGALYRYLAEAVWYPTALLPQAGVNWQAIDDHSARATLNDQNNTVSLIFRFNDNDEVAAIYSKDRFGRFDGKYRKAPWEGHFRDYHLQAGMRVPGYGEVGWYQDEDLALVWKGEIEAIEYEF